MLPGCSVFSFAKENSPRNGGRRVKKNDGGGEFNNDIFVRPFVNTTVYPQHNNLKKKCFDVKILAIINFLMLTQSSIPR
jgi:hypothetical protein